MKTGIQKSLENIITFVGAAENYSRQAWTGRIDLLFLLAVYRLEYYFFSEKNKSYQKNW